LKFPRRRLSLVTLAVLTLVLAIFAAAPLIAAGGGASSEKGDNHEIRGGGTSLVAGGTGAPTFMPVMTKFAFNWSGSAGRFECLALMPNSPAGPGSGNFETNAMYVTATITSAEVKGNTAVLKGTATVTGIGAGANRPYTLTVTSGGPGATLVLIVSGMTFNEIVIEGEIAF
jgi:hypothetical protein